MVTRHITVSQLVTLSVMVMPKFLSQIGVTIKFTFTIPPEANLTVSTLM